MYVVIDLTMGIVVDPVDLCELSLVYLLCLLTM